MANATVVGVLPTSQASRGAVGSFSVAGVEVVGPLPEPDLVERCSRRFDVVPSAISLLRSADAQLELAALATDGFDRFSHAHFAALRLAGSVVESVAGGKRVRRGEMFWQRFARLAPEFGLWAVVFEEGARLRSAMEAGKLDTIRQPDSEYWISQTREFRTQVLLAFGLDPRTDFTRVLQRVA